MCDDTGEANAVSGYPCPDCSKPETHKYVYVFVRKDIPHAYQIIQAGHALHEMGMDTERPYVMQDVKWNSRDKIPVHLILFQVKNEAELLQVSRELNEQHVVHHTFHEPDYDTGFTAIATELFGNTSHRRDLFKKYKMY